MTAVGPAVVGSKEWREAVTRNAAGKTVADLAFDEDGDYWVLSFTDGTEICFNRTMAEYARATLKPRAQ